MQFGAKPTCKVLRVRAACRAACFRAIMLRMTEPIDESDLLLSFDDADSYTLRVLTDAGSLILGDILAEALTRDESLDARHDVQPIDRADIVNCVHAMIDGLDSDAARRLIRCALLSGLRINGWEMAPGGKTPGALRVTLQ